MRLWSEVVERVRSLVSRSREDQDLDEELAFHLEMETEKNVRQGMGADEARRRAHVAFGGAEQAKEDVREARGVLWLENVVRDVQLAARSLRRSPGFSAVVVLTLGVGIGATTSVFALANWLLLRPIPGVVEPERLVTVRIQSDVRLINTISRRHVEDIRAATPALTTLAGRHAMSLQVQAGDGDAFLAQGRVIEGDYFGVLGLRPLVGRWFSEEERAPPAADDVVVVSARFWSTWLGRSPDAIGATMRLNGGSYRVIGVAPEGFHGTERTGDTDVWLPLAAYNRLRHQSGDVSDARIFYEMVGRLAPGETPERAEEQVRAAMAGIAQRDSGLGAELEDFRPTVYPAIGLPVSLRESTSRTLGILLGVVSILLLIACANVANLLLFRGLSRRGETAVRRALGGSGGRLVQQQVTQGLTLALLGGVAGVGLSLVLGRALEGQSLPYLPPVEDLPVDGRVLAAAFAAAVLAGLLATGLPALLTLRSKELGRVPLGERSVTRRGTATRAGMTVVQIAASLTLLVGALLLVRTVRSLGAVELGVDPRGVLVFGYDAAPQGYDEPAALELRQHFLDRVSALPGVESAAMSNFMPIASQGGLMTRVAAPGGDSEPLLMRRFDVSDGYFETIGTRLVAGRGFGGGLDGPPGPRARADVVLSVDAAREIFGDTDVVGRSIQVLRVRDEVTDGVVVGVAEDVHASGPRYEARPAVYLPLGERPGFSTYLVVRSNLPRERTERMARGALADLDPAIPFFHAESLSASVEGWLAEERLLARILGLFAVLAATLAGTGLYAVVAYSVAERRREIGIRVALGASGGGIAGLVARQSLGLTAIGVVFGVAGGYAASQLLASRLFEVTSLDPVSYLAAAAGLVAVAVVASVAPARAAAAVDPVATLKAG